MDHPVWPTCQEEKRELEFGGPVLDLDSWKESTGRSALEFILISHPDHPDHILISVSHWGWKPFYRGHFSHSDVTCPHQMQLESSEIFWNPACGFKHWRVHHCRNVGTKRLLENSSGRYWWTQNLYNWFVLYWSCCFSSQTGERHWSSQSPFIFGSSNTWDQTRPNSKEIPLSADYLQRCSS